MFRPSARLLTSFFGVAMFLASVFVPTFVQAQTESVKSKETQLSGTFTDFQLQPTANGRYKLAGKLTINNLSPRAAKKVRADFYLSTDTELDSEDLVHSIDLARYNDGKGKLKGNSQVEVPLKQKVVAFVGSALRGQYLLIQLNADNAVHPADHSDVIVVGPIQVP